MRICEWWLKVKCIHSAIFGMFRSVHAGKFYNLLMNQADYAVNHQASKRGKTCNILGCETTILAFICFPLPVGFH